MGSAARRKPKRLAEKLLAVRIGLGLSQNGLIRQMGLAKDVTQAEISMFERGIRVPSLPILLEYSRVANVYLEILVADDLDLPPELPAKKKTRPH
jgi:transcriptional regulator with XRE-family HTH domain